jgi:CAAX protease family protein
VLLFLMGLSILLYNYGIISEPLLEAYSSITLSLALPSMVFSYLLFRGNTIGQIISQLGLSRDRFTLKMIAAGILVFFGVMLFSLAISVFSTATNIQLPTNVQTVLAGTPLYFLVFTFLVAPINEEIFFRGFLVPRIGIIASALLFAVLHFTYASVSEFVAALFFGLLAGYVYKRTKSLYPSIVAHMIVNFITITSLIYLGMFLHL